MRLFTRTIELGSFSAVARAERITQPTVSKIIAALEKNLGVRLMERTTTSLTPTEEGRRFYHRCRQLIEEYVDAVADVRGQAQQLVGALTVNAPLGLGELRLNALVVEFLANPPRN
jgi:DNA-binding transcriptional LysR family regulator